MGVRRLLRPAAWMLAAIAVAGGAFAARRHVVASVGDRGATRELRESADAEGRASGARRPGPRMRERARGAADAEDAATAAPAADAARRESAAALAAQDPIRARERGDLQRESSAGDPSASALLAAPDRDPVTGEAPVVAPGRPDELALAAFVAHGADAVHPAAELVGARKPQVEDGVPVSLTGRVVEAEGGLPIAGARLVVSSTFYVRRYFYDHHLREVARVETDADGAFRIERLNADPAHFGDGGRMFLTVTAPGHAPALALPLAKVSPGVANRLADIALPRAAETLRGRVLDIWEGLPVAGARVHATGAINPVTYPKDERAALFVGSPTAVTDAEGRFVLQDLGRGMQVISVHGGDDCVGEEAVALPHDGEWTIRTRQIRGRIEGTTIDEHGDPVSLVRVEGGENSTHSFADGRFVLENFRGDVVTIRFEHPDHPLLVVADVRNGATGLVVRLSRARPTIVLEVRDRDTAAPVPRVQLAFAFEGGRAPQLSTSPTHIAIDGRYVVRIPERVTSLTVSAPGHVGEQVELAGRAEGETVPLLLGRASEK